MATIDFSSLPNKTYGTGTSSDLLGTEQIFINDSGNPKDVKLSDLVSFIKSDVGIPTVPTAPQGTNTTQTASTAYVINERTATGTLTGKTINLANNTLIATSTQLKNAIVDESGSGFLVFSNSPEFTGIPKTTTASPGTDNTQIASTEYVINERDTVATLTNKTIITPIGIVKGDVGLGNVDNTSDANKPVSTPQSTSLQAKLISGTTIKTVSGNSILQPGNIQLGGSILVIVPDPIYTASTDEHCVITGVSPCTITLPGTPVQGDNVWITVANTLSENLINNNGKKLMGFTETMLIDSGNITVKLKFINDSVGWIIV